MLQNSCKTLGFKKNMVYKIPPGEGKPYPASGLIIKRYKRVGYATVRMRLVLNLFCRSQMVNFKVPKGSNFSRGGGGVQLHQGGSNCLLPIETHITCDFTGDGSGPPFPPLDPKLVRMPGYEPNYG